MLQVAARVSHNILLKFIVVLSDLPPLIGLDAILSSRVIRIYVFIHKVGVLP